MMAGVHIPKPSRPLSLAPITNSAIVSFLAANSVPASDQAIISIALCNLQHITFQDFEQGLTRCVQRLNEALVTAGRPAYSIGIAKQKSNEWVSGLALDRVAYPPQDSFILPTHPVEHILLDTEKMKITTACEHLVLFDDCAYSGNQLCQSIRAILDSPKGGHYTIYVVVPFITDKCMEKYKEIFTYEDQQRIKFFSLIDDAEAPFKIKTVKEIFRDESSYRELLLAHRRIWKDGGQRGPTLCYTDWRYPDSASTMQFGRNQIIPLLQPGKNLSNGAALLRKLLVPPIPRPYGKKIEGKPQTT